MTQPDLPHEIAVEAAKGAIPLGVTAASLTGAIDWQMWVYVLTALFLLMQIGWLGWKAFDRWRGKGKPGD